MQNQFSTPKGQIIMEELSRFSNICLGITSHISTIPLYCKCPNIPILSIEAASKMSYTICNADKESEVVSNLIMRLDFHALSITLLTPLHFIMDGVAMSWPRNGVCNGHRCFEPTTTKALWQP